MGMVSHCKTQRKVNPAGADLADGYVGALTSLKGDLGYYTQVLQLRRYNANAMCGFCPAGRDDANP
eukprot:7571323-Alexandrium_andersonii.AAC.1